MMRHQRVYSLIVVVGLTVLLPALAVGQSSDDGWTAPRMPDGRPDLQGVWANNSATGYNSSPGPKRWNTKSR